MKTDRKKIRMRRGRVRGFSLVELLIVVFVVLIIAAIVIPNVLLAVSNIRLRASAGDLAGLMQQARILAAKNNATYAIQYRTQNGGQVAFVDLNNNGVWDPTININGVTTNEPLVEFSGTTVPAPGPPSGSGGEPPPYVLAGDTGTGSYDNTNTLGYTGRGLPCNYDTTTIPPTCSTPAAKYFVYYLTDTRVGRAGWAAVVVTKSGRCKIVTWSGGTWN
jgi:prepilin-type N-terminal cleavage/methylation domain-containing protein